MVQFSVSKVIVRSRGFLKTTTCFLLFVASMLYTNAQDKSNRNTDISLLAQPGDMSIGGNFLQGKRGNYTHYGLGVKYLYNVSDVFRLATEFDFFPKQQSVSWWDFSVYGHHHLVTNWERVAIYPLVRFGIAGTQSENWFAFSLGGGFEFALTSNITFYVETRYGYPDFIMQLFGGGGNRSNLVSGITYKFYNYDASILVTELKNNFINAFEVKRDRPSKPADTNNNSVGNDNKKIPINKGSSFLHAGTSNFGIIIDDGTTTFNMYANGGYYFANRLALIGGLGYNLQRSGDITTNILSGYAGLRCYLVRVNKDGLFINSSVSSSFDIKNLEKFKDGLDLSLGMGYSIFLNNSVAFEPIVNFVKPFAEGSSNHFLIGGGFSTFFNVSENTSSQTTSTNTLNKGKSFINAGKSNFGIIASNSFSTYNLLLSGGFFVVNKLALVGGLGFTMVRIADFSMNTLDIITGVRYYILEANNGGLFINSLLNVTKPDKLKPEFGFSLGAGYSIFLNNRIAFEPTANFVMPFTEGRSSSLVFGGGFSIYF